MDDRLFQAISADKSHIAHEQQIFVRLLESNPERNRK